MGGLPVDSIYSDLDIDYLPENLCHFCRPNFGDFPLPPPAPFAFLDAPDNLSSFEPDCPFDWASLLRTETTDSTGLNLSTVFLVTAAVVFAIASAVAGGILTYMHRRAQCKHFLKQATLDSPNVSGNSTDGATHWLYNSMHFETTKSTPSMQAITVGKSIYGSKQPTLSGSALQLKWSQDRVIAEIADSAYLAQLYRTPPQSAFRPYVPSPAASPSASAGYVMTQNTHALYEEISPCHSSSASCNHTVRSHNTVASTCTALSGSIDVAENHTTWSPELCAHSLQRAMPKSCSCREYHYSSSGRSDESGASLPRHFGGRSGRKKPNRQSAKSVLNIERQRDFATKATHENASYGRNTAPLNKCTQSEESCLECYLNEGRESGYGTEGARDSPQRWTNTSSPNRRDNLRQLMLNNATTTSPRHPKLGVQILHANLAKTHGAPLPPSRSDSLQKAFRGFNISPGRDVLLSTARDVKIASSEYV